MNLEAAQGMIEQGNEHYDDILYQGGRPDSPSLAFATLQTAINRYLQSLYELAEMDWERDDQEDLLNWVEENIGDDARERAARVVLISELWADSEAGQCPDDWFDEAEISFFQSYAKEAQRNAKIICELAAKM